MSYMQLVMVDPANKQAQFSEDHEYRNSWKGAMLLWDALCKIYLDGKSPLFAGQELWSLFDNPKLEIFERASLGFTFDNWYIEKAHFQRAADDIRDMMVKLNIGGHWITIRDTLPTLDWPAVGFYWTSVSEAPFNLDAEKREWPSNCTEVYTQLKG